MKKSRVCALGLACFLSAVTAFSALATLGGGGAFLADNHAGLSRFDGDETAASFAGANGATAAENLTLQEQLLAGTLELDPENDPVICTTESGLEIKYAQAINLGSGDKHANAGSVGGLATTPSGLDGYAYLSMGTYDNKPINWIIIGYNTISTTTTINYNFDGAVAFSAYLANPSAYNSFAGSLETSTDAGVIISSTASNGIVWGNYALSLALNYSKATPNSSELDLGEVLVLCQGTTGLTAFGAAYNNSYGSSTLLTKMRDLYYPSTYKNGAQFTDEEAELIVPKKLSTAGSTSTQEYLFP
ncbi:MAG: hypothetical protein IJ975_02700, partial [Clostridia bacterium]|nr:hypothetical protein [Clostridia bacterium]